MFSILKQAERHGCDTPKHFSSSTKSNRKQESVQAAFRSANSGSPCGPNIWTLLQMVSGRSSGHASPVFVLLYCWILHLKWAGLLAHSAQTLFVESGEASTRMDLDIDQRL